MKKIIICMPLLLVILFVSCQDWLDVRPDSEVPEEKMFQTEKGFQDALIGCYIKLNSKNLYSLALTIQEIEWLAQHWSLSPTSVNQREIKFKDFDYKTKECELFFKTVYKELYNTIAHANKIVEKVDQAKTIFASKQLQSVIEAEALGIRAFCHFDVLRLFGQVPNNVSKLVSLPYAETVSISNVPYYDYQEFVSKIIVDLDKAELLLSESDPVLSSIKFEQEHNANAFLSYRRFRFNYYAIQALKARLYLYIGDKERANYYANEVIKNSGLSLAGSTDFANRYYALPSECILALSNFELANPDYIAKLFLANNNDNSGFWLEETKLRKDLFSGQSMAINNRATYLWDRAKTDNQGRARPLLRKYSQPTNTSNTLSLALHNQLLPLIRLSEMYLIAIETAANETEANNLWKTYMLARNVPINSSLKMDQINSEVIKEYRREFFAEGQMFYTYKRLGTKQMLWKTDRSLTSEDYVVPLPSTEIKG